MGCVDPCPYPCWVRPTIQRTVSALALAFVTATACGPSREPCEPCSVTDDCLMELTLDELAGDELPMTVCEEGLCQREGLACLR